LEKRINRKQAFLHFYFCQKTGERRKTIFCFRNETEIEEIGTNIDSLGSRRMANSDQALFVYELSFLYKLGLIEIFTFLILFSFVVC
jgi:hypothetical protein